MAITNEADLTHIARTTEQWGNTYDRNVIIPEGVLCIEFTSSGKTNIKIGDGHHIFSRLPYVNGTSEIIDCYTKQETDNRIFQILNNECVVRIKGVLDDVNKLPVHAACGDLWFVIRQNPEQGNKFEEYLYSSEHHWELVGGTPVDIDLSKYATKEYVDGKIRDIESKLHTHDNKSILDQITAAFTKEEKDKLKELYNYDDTELRELIEKSLHNHSNKEVLDSITKYDIEKLRDLENYDDTLLKTKITALEKLAHEHSNKSILDKTTASFTTDYERLMPLIRLYIGATGFEDGAAGLVPPAKAGEQNYVLTGSGKWVPNAGGGVYELPIATKTELGGIKIGEGLEISEDGTLTVIGGGSGGGTYYEGDGIIFTDRIDENVRVPLGYVELSYIENENTDAGFIHTNYRPNKNTKMIFETSYTNASADMHICGVRYGGSSGNWIIPLSSASIGGGKPFIGFAYGNNSWDNGTKTNIPVGERAKYEVSLSGIYVNDTLINTPKFSDSTNPADLDLYIFGTNYNGLSDNDTSKRKPYYGKIYYFKIYEGSTLVHDYVPAYNIESGIAGLYDLIDNIFYTSELTEYQFSFDVRDVTEGIKIGKNINVKPATETEIGGVIIGDGINVDENGVISVDASAAINLKPGNGLEIVYVVNPEHTDLPNGYGEISYLESLNGQYTIIDYVPNENTRVVCEFSYQESNVGDQCLFGTRTGNTSGSRQFVLWMEWDSSKPYTGFVYGGNNWGGADVPSDGYTLTCEIGQKMVADVSVNGYYLDNTLIHTVTNTGSPSAYKLAIFHLSNSNTTVESNKTAFKGRIYSFKIYENDVLVANLIPAIVMALNIPGFYDVINNKFYQSSTSNSFTYDASSVIIDSAEKQINLLPATTTDIGGIIVGDGLSITEDGILSVSGEISDETYRAGLGINIEEKPIPGDIELDILNNEYAGWDNFTYLWTGGAEYEETNYVLHTTRDRIADEEGNWLTHFKIPDGVENIKVEAVAKDGTPLKFWIDNHDSETLYRWSLLGRWYDSGETVIYPDEYVPSLLKYNYISIGLCFDTNNTRTISVNDIDYVKLYFIEGDPENPKGMGKYINSDIASEYQLGGVIIGKGINVTEDGVISVDSMPLEPATSETLGGIKVGNGLEITEDGKLNVIGGGGTGSDCVTDVDLKQDAPGVIVVTKPNETKELDVFQYMTELEINCVEDSII